jgi:hypothetical protein
MSAPPSFAAVPDASRSLLLPTSFAQRAVWDVVEAAPAAGLLVVPEALRLLGRLDLAALREALAELVRRHELLRTTFLRVEGRLMARADATAAVATDVVDLRHVPISRRDAAVRRAIADAVERPFDLRREPLLRAHVMRVEDDDDVVLVTSHLIAYDSWSRNILARELTVLYAAFASGHPSPLAPPPLQYADFANWQNELVAAGHWDDQLRFWRDQLDGIAEPAVPAAGTPQAAPTFSGGRHRRAFPQQLLARARSLARARRASAFMVLLAAYQTLVAIVTDTTDIAVATPVLCRDRPELEAIVGRFVNYVVLRTDVSGNPAFSQVLDRARRTTLGALEHRDLPFEHVLERLRPGAGALADPLFRLTFAVHDLSAHDVRLPGLAVRELPVQRDGARYDLELHVWETGASAEAVLLYRRELFDASAVTALMDAFMALLELVVSDPERPLAAVGSDLRRVTGAAAALGGG